MTTKVDVQKALDEASEIEIPDNKEIQQWVDVAIETALEESRFEKFNDAQMTVRIVGEMEISQLNESYRHKAGVTNVLSFPFVPPPGIPSEELNHLLGDLVVCATVIGKEAREQHKSTDAHWAHMIVHGSLHLLGYDHQSDNEAAEMESLEKNILSRLGYQDPYREI